ncbi:alpha-(1-_3)-arabinofuranosyltransferase family protein, partial [Patescibacteria group bacterium]
AGDASFIGSVKISDAFRFIGSWAFESTYNGVAIVPFAKLYTTGILVVSTLAIAIVVFSTFLKRHLLRTTLFFLLLAVIGIFLAKGTNPPLGELFDFIYNEAGFWIFREPYTKFTPIILLAFSVLLGLAITMILQKLSQLARVKKILANAVVIAIIVCLILINAFPLLNGRAIWDTDNGPMKSLHSQVPEYWDEAADWLAANDPDSEVFLMPKAGYGQGYNWEHGIGSAWYVASVLLPNPVIGYPGTATTIDACGGVTSCENLVTIYELFDSNKLEYFARALANVDAKYILQQNDLDWEQGVMFKSPSPFVMKGKLDQIDGIKLVQSFDKLDLYQLDDEYTDNTVELRRQITYADTDIAGVFNEVAFQDGSLTKNFYLASQLTENEKETIVEQANFFVLPIRKDDQSGEKYFDLPKAGEYNIFLQNVNVTSNREEVNINNTEISLAQEAIENQNTKTDKQLIDFELINPKSCAGDESKSLLRLSIPLELSLAEEDLEGFFTDGEKLDPVAVDLENRTVDVCSAVNVSKAEMATPWKKWQPVDTPEGTDMYNTSIDAAFSDGLTTSVDDRKFVVSFLGDRELQEEFEDPLIEPYSINIGMGHAGLQGVVLITEADGLLPEYTTPENLPDDLSVFFIKKEDLPLPEKFTIRTSIAPPYAETVEKISLNQGRNSISEASGQESELGSNVILSAFDLADIVTTPEITYNHISATKYEVNIPETTTTTSLILKNNFNEDWEATIKGSKLPDHAIANGFANSWLIEKGPARTITISFAPQRILIISLIIVIGYTIFVIVYLGRRKKKLELSKINLEIAGADKKLVAGKFLATVQIITVTGFLLFTALIIACIAFRLAEDRITSDWLAVQAFTLLVVLLIVKFLVLGKKSEPSFAITAWVDWRLAKKILRRGWHWLGRLVKNYWPVMVIAGLGLASQTWFHDNMIIAAGDNYQYLNPGNLLDDYIRTVYVKTNAGSPTAALNIVFPFMFFWKILEILGLSAIAIQRLWAYLIFTIPGFTMYGLIVYLLRNKKYYRIAGLLGALLYMANTFIMLDIFQITAKPLHALFPLIFLLWIKGLNQKDKVLYYALWLSIISLFLVSSAVNIALVGAPALILLAYTIYFFITNRKKILRGLKFIGAAFVSIVIVNIWWIVVTVPAMLAVNEDLPTSMKSLGLQNQTHLIDIFRLLGHWGFRIKMYLSNGAIFPNVPFAENYYTFPLLLITLAIPVIAFSIFIFRKKISRLVIFLGVLAILGIFLSKGTNPPLGNLYELLQEKIPMFWVFREPFTKFMLIYLFSISILYGISVKYCTGWVKDKLSQANKQWIRKIYLSIPIIAGIIVIISAYPIFVGLNISNYSWYNTPRLSATVSIPQDWKNLQTWFEDNDTDGRVALFPKAGYGHSYHWDSGMVTGNYVAEVLLPNPIVANPPVKSISRSDQLITELYANAVEQDVTEFNKILDLLNVEYVLQQDDLAWEHAYEDTPDPATMHNFLDSNPGLEPAVTLGKLSLYRVKEVTREDIAVVSNEMKFIPPAEKGENFPDIIKEYQTDSAIFVKTMNPRGAEYKIEEKLETLKNSKAPLLEVSELSPTRYEIKVIGDNEFFLTFKMTFIDNWKATVLAPGEKFNPWDKQAKITENQHFITNGYANGWIVTPPACIQAEECGETYSVIIDYYPQNRLYLGLIISGAGLVLAIFYLALIYPMIRKKRLRNSRRTVL